MKDGISNGVLFGIVFVLAGLAFKISAVPFHMWTPDVYEGAPTPVAAFFATAPKVPALGLIVRVAVEALGPGTAAWQQIIIFLALASRTEENPSQIPSQLSISYTAFCLKKKRQQQHAI